MFLGIKPFINKNTIKGTQENHSNTGKKQMSRMIENFSMRKKWELCSSGGGGKSIWGRGNACGARCCNYQYQGQRQPVPPVWVVLTGSKQNLKDANLSTVYCHPRPHLEFQHLGGCGRRIVASLRPAWTIGQDLVLKAQTTPGNILWGNSMGFPPKNLLNLFPIYYCVIYYYLYKE